MSRIGKNPIPVPEGVTVSIGAQAVTCAGALGTLDVAYTRHVQVQQNDSVLQVTPTGETKHHRAMWGTISSLIRGAVTGVSAGHRQTLEFIGVGYRVSVEQNSLVMALGFSHEVTMPIPETISASVGGDRNRPLLNLVSIDKQALGQFIARIRRLRPPEPYKGKGIKFVGEQIRRKEGKKK